MVMESSGVETTFKSDVLAKALLDAYVGDDPVSVGAKKAFEAGFYEYINALCKNTFLNTFLSSLFLASTKRRRFVYARIGRRFSKAIAKRAFLRFRAHSSLFFIIFFVVVVVYVVVCRVLFKVSTF